VDIVAIVVSSALVSAVVGGLVAYLSQRALASRQARLDYEYAAKKRLYEAVGPLRFQLVIAARDLTSRVNSHLRSPRWTMTPSGYYVHSFLYRLLRPLAVGVLVERQMSYADFSVDPSSVDLLRFDRTAYRMLTGAEPFVEPKPGNGASVYYTGLDWGRQSQHIFRDNLRIAAMFLLKKGVDDREVVIDYAEFRERCPDPLAEPCLADLAQLFGRNNDSLRESGVFWVRLVGYAYCCRDYVVRHGQGIGVGVPELAVVSLLGQTRDPQIQAHLADYPTIFELALAPRSDERGAGHRVPSSAP
jgi:hypothetical protein